MPFTYPSSPIVRRHAPGGYVDYPAFKPWLRDEFTFRCVFCLMRELMYPNGQDSFSVEHLLPRSTHPGLTCEYTNLVYACVKCNSNKNDRGPVLDPCHAAYGTHLAVAKDGTIQGLTPGGRKLIRLLRLDRGDLNMWRRRLLRLARAARRSPRRAWAREVHAVLSYPLDMPDLRTHRPPTNGMPRSPENCAFARHERGELPATY
jgi:hypothetical protein